MQLAMCLAFFSIAQMGPIYLGTTLVLNALFIAWAFRLYKDPTPKRAWGLFRYSIYFLAALFGSMAVDALVF